MWLWRRPAASTSGRNRSRGTTLSGGSGRRLPSPAAGRVVDGFSTRSSHTLLSPRTKTPDLALLSAIIRRGDDRPGAYGMTARQPPDDQRFRPTLSGVRV